MDLSWDAIASKMVWSGRFPVLVDRIRSREDGREYDYTYLGITGGAVCVLALDEMDQAICVRQYRHPSGQVLLELPAGHLEPDELPASCAHREFEEETGLRLGSLRSLGSFMPVPALSRFRMHMFLGSELSEGVSDLDDTEILEVVRVPVEELREQVINDQHDNAGLTYTVLLASQRGLLPQ